MLDGTRATIEDVAPTDRRNACKMHIVSVLKMNDRANQLLANHVAFMAVSRIMFDLSHRPAWANNRN